MLPLKTYQMLLNSVNTSWSLVKVLVEQRCVDVTVAAYRVTTWIITVCSAAGQR